jgi:hypothetical protein
MAAQDGCGMNTLKLSKTGAAWQNQNTFEGLLELVKPDNR